jgi:hypothetical protein
MIGDNGLNSEAGENALEKAILGWLKSQII